MPANDALLSVLLLALAAAALIAAVRVAQSLVKVALLLLMIVALLGLLFSLGIVDPGDLMERYLMHLVANRFLTYF